MFNRFALLSLLVMALAAALIAPPATTAQTPPAAGVLAFVGVDAEDNAALYLLDLATGSVGLIDTPITPDADLQWHPDGNRLVFTTADGGYGLLRSLRGCFDAEALCLDLVEVFPPFIVTDIAWSPGEEDRLYLLSDEGWLQLAPPRARPADITALDAACDAGFAVADDTESLFCAATDSAGNIETTVYRADTSGADGIPAYTLQTTIGTFPAITAYDIGPGGNAALGTQETAGDSGFFVPTDGEPVRLASYQVHVYALAFHPAGGQVAIAGATADSTGDGTLRDGDPGELFLYDTAAGTLQQIPGFTGATALTWQPDGEQIAVVTGDATLALFTPGTSLLTPVEAALPDTVVRIAALDWNPAAPPDVLPIATPGGTSTPVPTPTLFATLTPFPSVTPFPTLTPLPTMTAFPTLTPLPTTTPGSPVGTGCEYAYVGGGGLPVAIGDTAQVTTYGAAVRLRTAPLLDATMIAELLPGTQMTILSGPYCGQGYRWWEVRLITNNTVGYVADSNQGGLWIEAVETPPAESIEFYADRTTITQGECVTIGWDVEGIKAVYFEDAGVTGQETREVCPTTTTTYTLRVVRTDDSEVQRQITITVNAP